MNRTTDCGQWRTKLNFVLLALMLGFSTLAQTTQKGIIQEYNEKAKKTPLSGVELIVRSANTTVSDKNGGFTLNFVVAKPGDHVVIRSIEKKGYEIFNKEAVEQWNINPDKPFVIVMCRSEKFKKIRDNYLKVSSESYAKRLRNEESQLAKLKAQGKLKEAEYNQQLLSLHENYERQLDNLDAYVDRFARIDLSEISSVEQEIIELVQQGKIDEAIERYEQLNIEDSLVDGINNLKKVNSTISDLSDKKNEITESSDSLYAMASRQIENLMIDADDERIEMAKSICLRIADADPSNIMWLIKTGDFLASSKVDDKELALRYYNMALDCAVNKYGDNHPDVIAIKEKLSSLSD